MAEKEEKDWSVLFAIVVVIVPVAIFFALDYTVLPYWKSGSVEEARFIATPEGTRLFVMETVSDGEDSSLERMKVYDPSDLRKKPVETYTRQSVSFRGFAGGRLWFESDDDDLGWHARDPRTLEVSVTESQLGAADARLRKVHDGTFTGDGLILSTLDGYRLRVDAETLSITEAPKDTPSRSEPGIESYEAVLPGGETKLSFDGQPRRQLIRGPAKDAWGEPKQTVPLGTTAFLDPHFLHSRTRGLFVLSDPESVLISHHKTVEYDSPLSISWPPTAACSGHAASVARTTSKRSTSRATSW
jgi:hypothetical protein